MAGLRQIATRIFNPLVALAVLTVAYPLRAESPPALAESARALHRAEFDRAAALARGYLKAHPQSSPARVLLARAEMARGQYASAYRELQTALRGDPRNVDALYYLSRLCYALSQMEHQKLYAMAPNSARVHQLMAESYRAQQNLAKAEEEYRAALDADPRSVEVLIALGDLLRSQFRFDDAVVYYSRAAETSPRNYDSAYGLGACYLFKEQPGRAVEYLRRALEIDPGSPAARLALGDALLRAGRPAEAVNELKAAAALEPTMRQAFTLLARAYNRLGQPAEAKAALARAQELTQKEKAEREALLASDDLAVTPPPEPGETQAAEPEE